MLRFSVHRLNRRIQQLAPRPAPRQQRAREQSAASKPTHICDLNPSIKGTYAERIPCPEELTQCKSLHIIGNPATSLPHPAELKLAEPCCRSNYQLADVRRPLGAWHKSSGARPCASRASKFCLMGRPPPYPVSLPLLPITRWQGMMMGIGFAPFARPTAREALGLPTRSASSPYEIVSP